MEYKCVPCPFLAAVRSSIVNDLHELFKSALIIDKQGQVVCGDVECSESGLIMLYIS